MKDRTAALVNNLSILAAISAISIGIACGIQSAWGLVSVLLMIKWIDWEHWADVEEEDDGGDGDEDDAVVQHTMATVRAPKSAPEDRRSPLN